MRDLILIGITLGCSFIAAFRPTFGLLAYIGYAVLSPQSYTWFFSRTFPHSKLIIAGTIIGYVVSSEAKGFPRQRESLLVLVLWGTFGLSTIFALDPEPARNEFIDISKIFLMLFITTALINTEDRLRLLLKIICLGFGLYAAKIGIFVLITGGASRVYGPENTYLAANNTIGMALAMNVPLLYYLSKTETRKWLRWSMRVMMVLSYPAVAGTFARGDWLGLAVITGLMLIKSKRKFLTLTAACIFAIVAVAWIPAIVSTSMSQRYDTLVNYEKDNSAESRFWNWEFCKRIGLAHPMTGAGFKFYSPQLYATYYPEFIARWGEGKVWACHNMYLTVLAEHGAPAFSLWIGILISCFISLRAIRSYAKAHTEVSWLTDYVDMLQLALIGFVIMGIFVDFAYYEIFYQLVAVIVIIKQKLAERAVEASKAAVVVGLNRLVLKS